MAPQEKITELEAELKSEKFKVSELMRNLENAIAGLKEAQTKAWDEGFASGAREWNSKAPHEFNPHRQTPTDPEHLS